MLSVKFHPVFLALTAYSSTFVKITGKINPARPGDLTAQLRRKRRQQAQSQAATDATQAAPKPPPELPPVPHQPVATLADAIARTEQWYADNQWQVFDYQRDSWNAWHEGRSGLIHSPTGSGKTLAAWLGAVQSALLKERAPTGLQVLWITPLRALAADTREQLQSASRAMQAELRIETRTGDTSSSRRSRQRSKPPFALITTPESLSVMLSYADGDKGFSQLHTVVVDEWHELLGSKRGVQLQLCLARLRKQSPGLKVWGVSATLANLPQAMDALIGSDSNGALICGVVPKSVVVESILPGDDQRFRWSGHLGLQLAEQVMSVVGRGGSTLVFTNTRAQAELWFQALVQLQELAEDEIALHHGSLDLALRNQIEQRLREGQLRCVVCTSSLDLGVDFSPVDQVMQIGSPKGVARLLQRAGRSGHQPGAVSRIVCVPTHAFELVEITAVRKALAENRIESRITPACCLDVLSQHLVTIAMGSGFTADDMYTEVTSTAAFAALGESQWRWVLDFITRGGQALKGYPQYHKVIDDNGTYKVVNKSIAQRHRMAIGTIVSDAQINIAFQRGKRLGSTEESFIARLKPGDTFQFAGRYLELVRVRDMTAQVKKASRKRSTVPRWRGTQMPISTQLADSVLETLTAWQEKSIESPELQSIDDMLQLQQRWSTIPGPDDLLIEFIKTREGYSLFCFPFAGRLAHEGLAMLLAYRLSRQFPMTLNLQINDYGLELQCTQPFDDFVALAEAELRPLFSTEHLVDDILASINSGEIARRQFRGIARIAGLVFNGYPGKSKSAKQVQASSGLIFDVLENYDADNLLLEQARREVLEQQLELRRIESCLQSIGDKRWRIMQPERLTPLAFPLWAESVQGQTFSSESFQARITKMLAQLESAAQQTLDHASGD
jgi:ATP-dependent Lhr-like helicase